MEEAKILDMFKRDRGEPKVEPAPPVPLDFDIDEALCNLTGILQDIEFCTTTEQVLKRLTDGLAYVSTWPRGG